MLKSISILSRPAAEDYQADKPTAVISIGDPGYSKIDFKEPVKAVLYQWFSDVNRSQYLKYQDYVAKGVQVPNVGVEVVCFSRPQADDILAFAKSQIDSGIDHFMVHCGAGLSRSPAVALALREIFMGEKDIPDSCRHYNTTVYQTLMYQANGGSYPDSTP